MSQKKFYFLWFSPRERKFIRPQVHVEIGMGNRENLKDDIVVSMNSNLPKWSSDFRSRRALTAVTGLTLILMWAVSLSSIQLGTFHFIVFLKKSVLISFLSSNWIANPLRTCNG
jgi:hypothetical protein